MHAIDRMRCLTLPISPTVDGCRRVSTRLAARPIVPRRPCHASPPPVKAYLDLDGPEEGIMSGEWEAGWSLVSYEDVQHYFDRKVLQEGKHASHQLASVMSTHLRVVYPNDPISEAKRHFEEVSGLPVLRPGDDVLVGIVSRKDLDKKPDAAIVGDVMSTPPLALKKSDTVEHAAAVMLKHKVHRVPIVDDDKLVIGMVTRTDLFRALSAGEHSG